WLGRWTASDPIGLGDGVNRYRYARNSPVVLNDLNGMLPPDGPATDRFLLRDQPRAMQDGAAKAVNRQTDRAVDGVLAVPRLAWEIGRAVVNENIRFFKEVGEYDPDEAVAETLEDPAGTAPSYLEPAVGDEVRTLVEGHDALTELYQASLDGSEVSPETRKRAALGVVAAFLAGLSAGEISPKSGGRIPSPEEVAARRKRAGMPDSPHPKKQHPKSQKNLPNPGGSRLSSEEFSELAAAGTVDPKTVRFSQDSMNGSFADHSRGSVDDLATGLRDFVDSRGTKGVDPTKIKPIRIVERDGGVFTLDNRRLKAFQDAEVDVPYKKLKSIPVSEEFKFTTTNGGVSIRVRGQK
ncbi:MAG: hypothetical protein KUG77_02080, partial [Nannocystaceae bacterium]|nr:hypothetical protein [Nannocystaceae bacterium]